MKNGQKEITVAIVAAVILLTAVWVFFDHIREKQKNEDIHLQNLIACKPDAVWVVNRPQALSTCIQAQADLFTPFTSSVPDVYLSLWQQFAFPSVLSFHPQGVLFYAQMGKGELEEIEKKIITPLFHSFQPTFQKKDAINLVFYPDTAHRFFGYYYHQGVWVASYSHKLLEETAKKQQNNIDTVGFGLDSVFTTLDRNVPLNVLFATHGSEWQQEAKGDSSSWHLTTPWWVTDVFSNEGNICFHGRLPLSFTTDSASLSLADTINARFSARFPALQFTTQIDGETDDIFYTTCCPL
ncbi:hypothetical protein D0T51_04685 [Parabacteroides sp. 52]|uniref:hypothetical protein n=1 Tax=unclassified Parabacteroides TaxID=2649774 RepID=UPI0013D00D9A|nr:MULTISPECIES: hypothetical protein [unclassified Parabacteroides]MDH6534525.1 hypothetical protein [Parabacteroides sp. PM5-20]NDV55025.1 hypothetical protein [Parabacteroides sp. 52]